MTARFIPAIAIAGCAALVAAVAPAQQPPAAKVWENAIQGNGYQYVLTLDGVIASRGGIPLIEGGKLIGAIGCSGGTGSQDEVACQAGVAALKKP